VRGRSRSKKVFLSKRYLTNLVSGAFGEKLFASYIKLCVPTLLMFKHSSPLANIYVFLHC